MPSWKHRTACLMLLPSLLLASACGTPRSPALQTFPPAEHLRSEPKPVPGLDTVTSAQAAAKHNIAIETWGQKGWDQVKAVCVWARERGMDVTC